jgi:DNA-binding transcriptional regulator YhcF (GntR family)
MKFTLDKNSGAPLYRQLAAQLLSAVEADQYRKGDRLPTEEELVAQTGLSKAPSKRPTVNWRKWASSIKSAAAAPL